MRFGIINIVGIMIGVLIAGLGFGFLSGNQLYFVLVVAIIFAVLPFVISVVIEQNFEKEKNERFLEFSRDLVGSVKSGTPVAKSIINLRSRDYGPLNLNIQKLANQISLGIPLTSALRTFANDSGSRVISRAVGLISEAEKSGGKIETIMESVSSSVSQIEEVKKERQSGVVNLVVQGYLIFIVFIVIMLVLEFKIIPLTSGIADIKSLSVVNQSSNLSNFSTPLFVMMIVQSIFAGLVIGKISEGELKAGVKHSFILLALTLLITTGARVLFG